jgi:hypothetical protein
MADLLERLSKTLAPHYRIDRELGRGGMATVFLAQDLRHQRPVAVKVLRPELAAALGMERFLRQIRLAARVTERVQRGVTARASARAREPPASPARSVLGGLCRESRSP